MIRSSAPLTPVLAALLAAGMLGPVALAGDESPRADAGQAASAASTPARPAGDTRRIDFVLPFADAHATARKLAKPLFLKPIYGGVDQLGARDYRCGTW